jgi:hypothetical protein
VPESLEKAADDCQSLSLKRGIRAGLPHVFFHFGRRSGRMHSFEQSRHDKVSGRDGAGFLSHLPVNLILAVKAKTLLGNLLETGAHFQCPSAHSNPTGIAA